MIRRFFTKVKYLEQPGDIVFVNGYGNVVITGLKDIDSVARRPGYSPYGVVVLPSWHHRYNDGSMGIMSLKNTGYMPYGPGAHDSLFDSLPFGEFQKDGKGNLIPVLEEVGPDPRSVLTCPILLSKRQVQNIHIPNDYFTSGDVSCNRTDRYNPYRKNDTFSISSIQPNIYNADGSGNSACDTTEKNWFIYDYRGFENTKSIYERYGDKWDKEHARSYSYNQAVSLESHEYPLVKTAVSFGVNGRWYVPGLGEMQYIVSRFSRIQKSLEKIREYADCDLLADSYFTSTVMNTRYVKDGITVDRMSGYWMDANGLPGMQPNNIFYSWVSNKNYCHRGRFMCRWSRNLGFINMLNSSYKNIRQ